MADTTTAWDAMPSWAQRSTGILGVLANHNFYVNGFSPRELRTTLEDLGPTYVKIGQIMSSRTDMLPKAYCKELETLRSSVAPLPAEVARAVIEQETGKRIEVDGYDRVQIGGALIDNYLHQVLDVGASHVDLYDNFSAIPFDKLQAFFGENL